MIEPIAQAVATMEGFYKERSLAQRNNNPGNLRSWGSHPVVNGYAKFPSAMVGWRALHRQIDLNIARGLTLYEFFGGKAGVYGGYAPAGDSNNPKHYAEFVAKRCGLNPGLPIIGQIADAPAEPS